MSGKNCLINNDPFSPQGVPIRVEVGPKDLSKKQLVAVRRDTGEKVIIPEAEATAKLQEVLDAVHDNLFAR